MGTSISANAGNQALLNLVSQQNLDASSATPESLAPADTAMTLHAITDVKSEAAQLLASLSPNLGKHIDLGG